MTSGRPGERLRSRAGGTPWPLGVPAVVAMVFLVLPLVGLLVRAPWATLPSLLSDRTVGQALRLSLVTATLATAVSLVVGVPLAWVLARVRFPGRQVLRALVTLPLVLPPVVGGVALFLVLGRQGIVGRRLFETTSRDDRAIAALEISGLSRPAAAIGRASTL